MKSAKLSISIKRNLMAKKLPNQVASVKPLKEGLIVEKGVNEERLKERLSTLREYLSSLGRKMQNLLEPVSKKTADAVRIENDSVLNLLSTSNEGELLLIISKDALDEGDKIKSSEEYQKLIKEHQKTLKEILDLEERLGLRGEEVLDTGANLPSG